MNLHYFNESWDIPRRDFLCLCGALAGSMPAPSLNLLATSIALQTTTPKKKKPFVQGAFLYTPTQILKKDGYYSWPGSGFDAEGHQKQYTNKINDIARKLNMHIRINRSPLYTDQSITRFINMVRQNKPDGLLLIVFKKSEWRFIERIANETGIPTVAMTTAGVLLMPHIQELYRKPGLYVIASLDNFNAIEYGMRMIRTSRWMAESRILSVTGTENKEMTVEQFGTHIRVVPMQTFVDVYHSVDDNQQVKTVAQTYLNNAKKRVEPSESEVFEAAKLYVACKRIMQQEQADAIMMNCLQGIQDKQIAPPCMAYMSLRDEGVVASCQNDLDSTLTMMLIQQLFDKPGFQQNASCDTEKNLYFGAHCTCPSKLNGSTNPAMPYILRNHAEAGVGVVPQVLWPKGQEVTMAHYLTGLKPQILIYSGKVVTCHDSPPAGGCRTNVVITINEIKDACEVKGMHQTIFFGNHTEELKAFCRLYNIATGT
jgi:hypothetical protein